jgi:hypothetical protein
MDINKIYDVEIIFKYADGEHTVSANILGDYCEA